MLNTFIARHPFAYNIPSLDKLLATKEIPDSFLLYDEQILTILQAAGIPGPDAYAAIKSIKKKKADKVASYKERFKEGFTKYLKETENATEEKAKTVVEQIWTIIENAANYMFCAAHAFSMACDSLYVAWLKVHYPYELYAVVLKLYSEKKNKEKIAKIILEMKRYKGISLLPGRFKQDNRDWSVDKDNKTISQSLSSIRYLSKQAAEDLYQLGLKDEIEAGCEYIPAKLNKEGKKALKESDPLDVYGNPEYIETEAKEIIYTVKLDCFTNILRALQIYTCLDTRQIKTLIELNYFQEFGKPGKLMMIFNEYFEGKNKITKTIKSFNTRLEALREFEKNTVDVDLPIRTKLQSELDNIGLCLSSDPKVPKNEYFITEVDAKWGTRAKIYAINSGKSGEIRIRKNMMKRDPMKDGSIIQILDGAFSPRYTYKNGERSIIPGEKEYWVKKYKVI